MTCTIIPMVETTWIIGLTSKMIILHSLLRSHRDDCLCSQPPTVSLRTKGLNPFLAHKVLRSLTPFSFSSSSTTLLLLTILNHSVLHVVPGTHHIANVWGPFPLLFPLSGMFFPRLSHGSSDLGSRPSLKILLRIANPFSQYCLYTQFLSSFYALFFSLAFIII